MPGLRQKATKASNALNKQKLDDYFEKVDGGMRCNITDCNSMQSRTTTFYLKRHLKTKHYSIYKKLFEDEVRSHAQHLINAFETKQHAITLVTTNGYPLSLLDKSSFRYLIKPGLDTLAEHGQEVTVNRKVITEYIQQTSDEIRAHIKNELRAARLFSLMFDITTKATLSVLGISASFIFNDTVIVRSLGIIHITKRHNGENIADMVNDNLNSFDASLAQIFAITTDNGSNMIRTTRMINEMLESMDSTNEDEIEYVGTSMNGQSDEEDNDPIDDDEANEREQRLMEILNSLTQNITLRNDYIAAIPGIRCCAHTLQLAIHDALNRSNTKRTLGRIKEMCKALRNQVINTEFRRLSPESILPPLDSATRWCSAYVMVNINF